MNQSIKESMSNGGVCTAAPGSPGSANKKAFIEKSRIRETLNLLTNVDSSTDTTVGWTKNTQKPKKNKNGKNNPKRKNSKTSRDMPKLATYPSTRGL
jgi:hypothetical protein